MQKILATGDPRSRNFAVLIDLHRHLEGSVRPETILDLGQQFGIPLPASDIEGLLPHISVGSACQDLCEFLEKFRWVAAVLGDVEACRRIAVEAVEDAAAEGVQYLELRFSPCYLASRHGLDPSAAADAVHRGVQQAATHYGIHVTLIGCITRGFGPVIAGREARAILENRSHFVAADIAGDELHFPARLFERIFDDFRSAGLGITAHAGEADGPHSVREAVERLGATRIGHGTRAIEDSRLIDLLGERSIGLECCLTSNLHTGAIPHLAAHPIRQFLDLGLAACINSDDPRISRITLPHELQTASRAAGLSPHHLALAAQHARTLAFGTLPEL